MWMGFSGILGTHTMMSWVIARFGTKGQRARYLPRLATGELRGGTAITEPDAGSDVAAVRTHARCTDSGYVLSGTKTFLTNGENGNVFLVVAKTRSMRPRMYSGLHRAPQQHAVGQPAGHLERPHPLSRRTGGSTPARAERPAPHCRTGRTPAGRGRPGVLGAPPGRPPPWLSAPDDGRKG